MIRAPLAASTRVGRLPGIAWAALTMLIWAAYPVVTRLSVTQTLSPEDLFALRFGISAVLFAPYLAWRAAALRGDAWLKGVGIAACQGTLAALVIGGLELAPASHASALVQGVIPAWLLIVGAVFLRGRFQRRNALGVAIIAAGVLTFVISSGAAQDPRILRGDFMFLLASLLACGYVLQTRHFGLPPAAAAAFVAVYSAIAFLPWYLLSGNSLLAQVSPSELILQATYQGVLVGFVSFIALNRAIASLGCTTTGAFLAAVPILTAIIAIPILGEPPPLADCAALLLITLGVGFVSRASQVGAPGPLNDRASAASPEARGRASVEGPEVSVRIGGPSGLLAWGRAVGLRAPRRVPGQTPSRP